MSLRPLRSVLRRPLCGDDECESEPLLNQIFVALARGAAPVLVTYAIEKLDSAFFEEDAPPETDT